MARTTETPAGGVAPRLRRRDYILLPLLSFITIVSMFAATELATRMFWVNSDEDSCMYVDAALGPRYKANCVSRTKIPESPWLVNRYNSCGYRETEPCGPKAPGTARVVVMGSSMGEGYLVPENDTYLIKASSSLSRDCRRRVEFQNLGVPEGDYVFSAYLRVQEALALKPDAVLLVLTPLDLEKIADPKQFAKFAQRQEHAKPKGTDTARPQASPFRALPGIFKDSRTMLVARHYLFQNSDLFAKMFLMYGDKADYLRQPFTPNWERRFDDVNKLIGDMAAQFRASGVPFIITLVPSRPQAALFEMSQLPPHLDPYAFDRKIAEISRANGIRFLDVYPAFSHAPHPDRLYYLVNQHLTAEGDQLFGRALVRQFTNANLPGFSKCQSTPTSLQASRRSF